MALPHFEVATFPGQILWLIITAGITYGFNKLLFIPLISSSISKRQKIIDQYIEDSSKLDDEIINIQHDIDLLVKRSKIETKLIIDEAVGKSQAMLLEHVQESNKAIANSMREYDENIAKSKIVLAENANEVVKDIKDKIFYFISKQNI